MSMISKFFKKYTGFLRRVRWFYTINNWFHANQLKSNKPLYEKAGLQKSVFQSVSSADFPADNELQAPWLDQGNAKQKMEHHPAWQQFDSSTQALLKQWPANGYLILRNFFSQEDINHHNQEIQQLIQSESVEFEFSNRIKNAFEASEFVNKQFFKHPELIRILDFLLGVPVLPFQTLHFMEGTQQKAHSDSFHMTTEPKGYLIAAWIALEDCDQNNGTLFYHPGSHQLDYIMSEDFDHGHSKFLLGKQTYKNYEAYLEAFIQEKQLPKATFDAKAGDV
ncbi:MAG: phytanoyl-CoA dioxygenase family protein, partial [Bacteroidota bacterium]